jgi:hypothetical protein
MICPPPWLTILSSTNDVRLVGVGALMAVRYFG